MKLVILYCKLDSITNEIIVEEIEESEILEFDEET